MLAQEKAFIDGFRNAGCAYPRSRDAYLDAAIGRKFSRGKAGVGVVTLTYADGHVTGSPAVTGVSISDIVEGARLSVLGIHDAISEVKD